MIVITTIDVLPDLCYECPCRDGENGHCQADKERRYSDYRPYWCPLKDIPNEQEVTQKDGYNLKELWKRARAGEMLNETELNFLLADWDERNIFKTTGDVDVYEAK